MLEGIGRIGDYTKLYNLKQSAEIKISTGMSVDLNKGDKGIKDAVSEPKSSLFDKMMESTKATKKKLDEAKTASIKDKLKRGKKLSATELKYLKDTDEALYRKAQTVQNAREELERDLKRAKTKQEARLAMVRAAMKVSTQAAMANGAGASASATGANADAGAGGSEALSAGSAGASSVSAGEGAALSSGNAMTAGGADAMSAAAISGEGGAAAVSVSSTMATSNTVAASGTSEATSAVSADGAQAADASTSGDARAAHEATASENKAAASSAKMMEMLNSNQVDDFDMTPTEFLIFRALNDTWSTYTKS
ncbi:MAG: hypothetical protein ACI4OA_08335, partial [Selenomonadaceae bacterium]